ncbi:ABC transporter permease [Pengzhenrongella frigida]|uniref:ABC transporter permease n=1 Tax=Pengzhenrongella frigida TaxID=1259133 RepID=A0A4V1ZHJ4_9MICO|nr:ABC transporter permease [Cellulomonas sp. HLT2-17]RYV52254.1 ABC transporter permease [Cellulomonas sp. HLT2-17]
MTGIVGAIVEAWDELRIHKLRVLLALIGVAVAVCAITGITAAAQMMNQAVKEQTERSGGRATTLMVSAYPTGSVAPTGEQYDAEFTQIVERYGVEYASRELYSQLTFRFPNGAQPVQVQAVDVDYGVMRRVQPVQGTWFAEADADRFAPAVVVNEDFLELLGVSDLSGHPTVMLGGKTPVRTTILGVVATQWEGEGPTAFLLYDHFTRWASPDVQYGPVVPNLSLWVPPEMADELTELVRRDMSAGLPGTQTDVYQQGGGFDVLEGGARWVITGIGGVALLLGGLGLVNIALVTVRYRIREIGIRRSFGATSGRVFFGVLMESVVATVLAGLLGVMAAIVIIKNIPVERIFGAGLQDVPPFPLSAALVGMACATAVGALAGLIPAIVAVRVKVIDAIRY